MLNLLEGAHAFCVSIFRELEYDKEPCWHRDWREKEHDGAAWVENAKGKQHTKNPTGGTNGRVYIPACLVAATASLNNRCGDDGGKIQENEVPCAERAFHITAKQE
jgi:hypothetical protein